MPAIPDRIPTVIFDRLISAAPGWGTWTIQLELVWTFSDICNALMALPNLIGIIAMSGVVAAVTKEYFDRKPEGKFTR